MMDAHTLDHFFIWDLAELPPARDRQPGRKVGNWCDDFHGIAGAARKMLHALMDKNSLDWIDFVGVQTCERQDSQEQSRGSKFADRKTLNSIECVQVLNF